MSAALNPFGDQIVTDARAHEPAVPGLNDRPLQALTARFAALAPGALPHPLRPPPRALLVVSEAPGYGKSHLVARLFRELHGRASLVYVQPFQNVHTPFQSLAFATVRELHFPDRSSSGAWDRDAPSQLDLLAHAVLAHTVADLIEQAVPGVHIDAEPGTAAEFRRAPLETFGRGQSHRAAWLNEHWAQLEGVFEPALAQRGLRLHDPGAWCRVLRAYAFAPFDPAPRRICLEWMSGQPIESDEAARIGLRPADVTSSDTTPEETNRLCRERLHDLCELSAFFRPFVFCFDQTEVYGSAPALARVFGMLVATMVNELRGHQVLVTANQIPWNERISPPIEHADLERFEPPLLLEGINRAQGEQLVRLRLKAAGIEEGKAEPFLKGAWFKELFPAEQNQIGTRTFLKKCAAGWGGQPEAPNLESLFAERRDRILANPKRHAFEPDTLQWLVETGAQGLPGVEVAGLEDSYVSVQWSGAHGTTLFGFIAGSNHRQWQAIARSSQARRPKLPQPCRFLFFRAPGQLPIPKSEWQVAPEIEAAKRTTLHVITLSLQELAELYAPRELYADAAQGDISYSLEEVLAFIRERLAPYWTRFTGAPAMPAPAEAPRREPPSAVDAPPFTAEVRAIVEESRFLSLEELLTKLNRPELTRDDMLQAVGYCGEIRVHSHPKMIVLQWQPRG